MKGIIFREFLELVERDYGYELVDKLINQSELPNNGAYTSVGTYPFSEMQKLLIGLSKETQTDAEVLLKHFGTHLFGTFKKRYPHLFLDINNAFDFLSKIENTIHVEVQKLYPQAELPTFEVKREADQKITLNYHSSRKLGSLAEGLIISCLEHFNEKASIRKEITSEDHTSVRFIIQKENGH